MESWYSDMENLTDTLSNALTEAESGSVKVVRSDVVVDGLTFQEAKDRNVLKRLDHICSINWKDISDIALYATLEIQFHESQLTNEFRFESSNGNWTDLAELAPELSEIVFILKTDLDAVTPWFVEIDTASLSSHSVDGGADREFKYETAVSVSHIRRTSSR